MAQSDPIKSIDEQVVAGLYLSPSQPNHNQKWAELDANEAPMARAALLKANQLRALRIDPGQAYLEGIADLRAALRRQPEL